MILNTLVARGFFRPSHHYLPCRKREVVIPVPWGVVQAWAEYSDPLGREGSQAEAYVLRFLGSRGRAEMATLDPADRLQGTAMEVWTVNPPGFGSSTGPPDLERYAESAVRAMDALRAHARGRPIWICGKSIGTAAALLAASTGGADGVILRNAMPLKQLLSRHYAARTAGLSRWALAPAIPERLDSVRNAARTTAAALFLVSRDDRVVPRPYQRQVIDAHAGAVTVLEVAGGHDERALIPQDEAAYRSALCTLVEKQ